jgi:hypothetical protein
MSKFGSGTEVTISCKKCGVVEVVILDDLPKTPGGKFILIGDTYCIRCFALSVMEKGWPGLD